MGFDIDRLIAVDGIHDHRQIEPCRVATGESAVAVGRPLHRCAHAIAITEVDIVAHSDLVAIVDDRRAGKRHQKRVHELDLPPVVVHQGSQAASDPEVDAGARVGRIGRPEVVAFDIGHHLERELIVVAQEQSPLAVGGYVRRLPQDVRDRKPIFLGDRHVDARHQREVVRHVAFVAFAKIGVDVFRPLVCLGEKHLAGRIGVQLGSDLLDDGVGFRQIFVVGSFALAQIRNCVQTKAVDAEIKPSPHDLDHGQEHVRIVKIEIRLMRKEAMPVVGLRLLVPGPI